MIDENTVDTRTERVKQKYIYIYIDIILHPIKNAKNQKTK